MSTNENHNPRDTDSRLGQCYWKHHDRVMEQAAKKIMGHVSIEVLEGIEAFALTNTDSCVSQMCDKMLRLIGSDAPAGDPTAVKQFNDLYDRASDIVFPATRALLKVVHELEEYSNSHSLSAIDLKTLQAIDEEAHRDPVLNTFRTDLKSRLNKVESVDDVTAYSQVFEIYGEVITYLVLRKFMRTTRLDVREGKPTPDFRCEPCDGKPFYVEVKTFDIVGGDARKRSMLRDGLDAKVQLEDQRRAGESVAFATTVVAPYRKYGEADGNSDEMNGYSPWSLIRVIDTLRQKSLQSFKQEQFNEGPTLGLVVLDRLLLPRGEFDLAPYYHADLKHGYIASGVLWHMAYGRPGTPIFRMPEFPGAQSLEGHLGSCGLFVDKTRPFPGPGLIVLYPEAGNRRALGLLNEAYSEDGGWSIDDTKGLMCRICDHWNDHDGSRFWANSADVPQESPGSRSGA